MSDAIMFRGEAGAVVTSVCVEEGFADRVTIWNRGEPAGCIIVSKGDGRRIARLLLACSATGYSLEPGDP